MRDLDAPERYGEADPSDYLGVIEAFPEQFRAGVRLADDVELPTGDRISSVVVLGMGGSGISGDVLELALGSAVPTQTIKSYAPPKWVGPETLVFAASYSGDTEETLAAYEAARGAGARLVCVTTGGRLAELARSQGVPVVTLPPGLQPRAALGYLAGPMIAIAGRLGLAATEDAVAETESLLEKRAAQLNRQVPHEDNLAKQLAHELLGRLPIVYGSAGAAEVAAYRWKCQVNECSKMAAYWHSFPELNHNEIVGWAGLRDLSRSSLALITLRHRAEHPRVAKRFEVTIPLIRDSFTVIEEVSGEGESPLATFFDLAYIGDFMSTYLAILQEVDPAPVRIIQELKAKLAED